MANLGAPRSADAEVRRQMEVLGLDEASAREEFVAGHSMTLEEAVAYALSDE